MEAALSGFVEAHLIRLCSCMGLQDGIPNLGNLLCVLSLEPIGSCEFGIELQVMLYCFATKSKTCTAEEALARVTYYYHYD